VVAIAEPLPARSPDALVERVRDAVGSVAGIERVDVDVREMTDEEKAATARVVKGEPPADPLQVVDASASRQPGARPRVNPFTDARTRIIAVASGKGGVGKSSVTTNLSIAL